VEVQQKEMAAGIGGGRVMRREGSGDNEKEKVLSAENCGYSARRRRSGYAVV
jgi:hypothetical protein